MRVLLGASVALIATSLFTKNIAKARDTGKPADKPVGTSGSNEIKSETRRLKVSSMEMVAGDCRK